MTAVMAGVDPQVGYTRLAALNTAELGQAQFRCKAKLPPRAACTMG